MRRINWKSTARTGKLAVTEYAQGYANDLFIALDCEAAAYVNTGFGKLSAFEYAVSITTALAAEALRQGSQVTLLIWNGSSHVTEEFAGLDDYAALMERLARVEPEATTPFAEVLTTTRPPMSPGTVFAFLTPRTPDDVETENGLATISGHSNSRKSFVFRLDGPSFLQAQILLTVNADEVPMAQNTLIGSEIEIGAFTDLASLLGGRSLG
jgi:uncharacterized protein (DUF58 family)